MHGKPEKHFKLTLLKQNYNEKYFASYLVIIIPSQSLHSEYCDLHCLKYGILLWINILTSLTSLTDFTQEKKYIQNTYRKTHILKLFEKSA